MRRIYTAQRRDTLLPRRAGLAKVGMLPVDVRLGFFKRALFGMEACQCPVNGLANVGPISFGTRCMLVNLLQLVLVNRGTGGVSA